jgi:hypothetical protein
MPGYPIGMSEPGIGGHTWPFWLVIWRVGPGV